MTRKETLESEILKLNKQIAKESTPPEQKISFAKVKDKKQAELDALIAAESTEKKEEPKAETKKEEKKPAEKNKAAKKSEPKKKAPAKEKKPKREIRDNGLSVEDCEEVLQEKKQEVKKNRKAVKKSEGRSTQEKTADSLEGVLKHIVKDKKTKATAKKDPAKIKKAVKKMDSAVKGLVSALAAFGIVISASRAKKIAEILKDLA